MPAATGTSRPWSSATGPTDRVEEVRTSWLFVFIGASPRTDWLGEEVVRDPKGFVVTGQELMAPAYADAVAADPAAPSPWRPASPGVFAAGDVRLDSMKRVASAVGEGRHGGLSHPSLPGDDLMPFDELRRMELFTGVSDDQLHDLVGCRRGAPRPAGEQLFRAGRPAEFWWVLLDGTIELVRHVGAEDTVLGAMSTPGQWAGGFRAWDDHGVYMATGRVVAPTRVLRVPAGRPRCASRRVVPLRRPPHQGAGRNRPDHRVDRASA